MITLRNYPYPFRSILSICSDLDETPSEEIYFDICKYLNTTKTTSIGKGVGLEVGNSIYFKMPKGQFSYDSASAIGKEKVIKLIKSGHIDCLHSFGDLVRTREEALMYWDLLRRNECNIRVWIDHAQASSNLDPDIMQGEGAIKDSPVYHADVLFGEGGIKYVWKGRVSSVIGQNIKRNLKGIFNPEHPFVSMKTVLKELVKGAVGAIFSKKYYMHYKNNTLNYTKLDDGTPVCEFMRSNPSWAGVSSFEKGRDVDKVLTEKMLNHLIKYEGSSILYTHLGKVHSIEKPFNNETIRAFEMLAEKFRSGEILTLTTKRQLDYLNARNTIKYRVDKVNKRQGIMIESDAIRNIDELSGLTWYVDEPREVDVFLNGEIVKEVSRMPKDYTGRSCIMVPLKPLVYPDI